MIKLNTLNNYILFTEDNGDASAIGKLSLTYKIEDEDITFFVLKEGNKKIYTIPFISSAIKNLEIDGVIYSKEDIPTALGNIFLPPSGSGSSGEVTPADIAYLQQQINVSKVNVNKSYVIATYEDDLLTLITLSGIQTKLHIPYFDSNKYYLKTEIDSLLSTINTKINTKADKHDVYTKSEVDDIIDDLNIDPAEIASIEADVENLKSGTISKVVYTTLDGKLTVTDYKGNITTYVIPYFDSSKYYTKTQTDTAINTSVNSLNTSIQTKFTDYYKKSETYSKTETDSKLAAIPTFDSSNYYTKTQTDTALNNKANVGDVYTKIAIDNLLSNKANSSDVYTKAQTYTQAEVNTLLNNKANVSNVYTKSEVYSKTEVDNKLLTYDTDITTIENKFNDYYTKTQSDAKYVIKNTYSNVAVSGASSTCNFTTYNYYHLTLSGSGATVALTINNLPEYGKDYYVSVQNNRTVDVEITGLSTITGEIPVIKSGGIAEISVMKWGNDTIRATFIVSA